MGWFLLVLFFNMFYEVVYSNVLYVLMLGAQIVL